MKKELALNSNLKKLVLAAMFAALSCVATMVIQIPSPMSGYVNLGDCFVLLGGIVLGPVWGFLAGGVGSMLADVISGYAHYAPGTFLIKGLMALAVVLIFKSLTNKLPRSASYLTNKLPRSASYLIAATASEFIMIAGYFGYASIFLGKGLAAASSIPGNIMQGIFGVVSSFLLLKVLERTKLKDRI